MTKTDRILIGLLAAGVWVLTLAILVDIKPAYAISIDASEIDGLEEFIEEIVGQECTVSGDVYIHDLESGYGELSSGTIDCY